ncbi:hypothetical protein KUTeg_008431 [Tegillarca granosa]|uniref:Uncharacterized protein n=1 Tax=Tegillarca granosa TaxID=220873 RepID=A0ABQ9FC75_TEGGR|nr:hypothetical protein KUTeg_008431 [Tegillarca granosa]
MYVTLSVITVLVILYLVFIWILRSLKINKKNDDLYVIVTGCDSGFGQELAYKLDKLGFNVYAACLTEKAVKELDMTTSERLRTAKVDVTKSEDIANFYEFVKNALPNEKGVVGHMGFCDILGREQYIETLNVNLFGMIEMNRKFLPLLRQSKGRIINTSSVAGRLATGNPCYTISKYGVEGYSDCLRRELYNQGVTVHIIEPGSFATPLITRMTKANLRTKFQTVMDKGTKEEQDLVVADLFTEVAVKVASKDTYKVVNAYHHALTARYPKTRYLVGIDANIIYPILWTIPDWITDILFAYAGLGKSKKTLSGVIEAAFQRMRCMSKATSQSN